MSTTTEDELRSFLQEVQALAGSLESQIYLQRSGGVPAAQGLRIAVTEVRDAIGCIKRAERNYRSALL